MGDLPIYLRRNNLLYLTEPSWSISDLRLGSIGLHELREGHTYPSQQSVLQRL